MKRDLVVGFLACAPMFAVALAGLASALRSIPLMIACMAVAVPYVVVATVVLVRARRRP